MYFLPRTVALSPSIGAGIPSGKKSGFTIWCISNCNSLGTGKVTINDRDIDNYFGLETLKLIVRSPLVLLGLEGKYDVVVRVSGGGVSGQAGAIRHGLSRALLQQSDENRAALKKAGFLTRDPRMKERKKYGLKAARRAPQFSKR